MNPCELQLSPLACEYANVLTSGRLDNWTTFIVFDTHFPSFFLGLGFGAVFCMFLCIITLSYVIAEHKRRRDNDEKQKRIQ